MVQTSQRVARGAGKLQLPVCPISFFTMSLVSLGSLQVSDSEFGSISDGVRAYSPGSPHRDPGPISFHTGDGEHWELFYPSPSLHLGAVNPFLLILYFECKCYGGFNESPPPSVLVSLWCSLREMPDAHAMTWEPPDNSQIQPSFLISLRYSLPLILAITSLLIQPYTLPAAPLGSH